MPQRASKTADAALRAEMEAIAKLSARERALLALRLGREMQSVAKKARSA